MTDTDAKNLAVSLLTRRGVSFCPGRRLPLDPEEAARVYELLVEQEDVLAPGPGTTHPDGRPGAAHVPNHDLARTRARGNDARTLAAVVLTSHPVRSAAGGPLEVDEALIVYELLVEEVHLLVPSASTYYPRWGPSRDEGVLSDPEH